MGRLTRHVGKRGHVIWKEDEGLTSALALVCSWGVLFVSASGRVLFVVCGDLWICRRGFFVHVSPLLYTTSVSALICVLAARREPKLLGCYTGGCEKCKKGEKWTNLPCSEHPARGLAPEALRFGQYMF
jgi:hypothetical protein